MLIFWRIRYLDRSDQKWKDRDLFLDTLKLDPPTKGVVELFMETRTGRNEREIFKFRHLFTEGNGESLESLMEGQDSMEGFALTHYFEDENGKELSGRDMGEILTGDPDNELLPFPLEQHDLELRNSDAPPIPVESVVLDDQQLKSLGYFCRDVRKLAGSTFFKEERPARLRGGGDLPAGEQKIETAANDEEIDSFVMTFRRLALTQEAGNFAKAAKVFAKALNDHPLAKWVLGEAKSFESKLDSTPTFTDFGPFAAVSFSRKRLLEIFVYTQYAHQPDDANKKPDQQRERQFAECLKEVGGNKNHLTWLFLSELHFAGRQIHNAGKIIAAWFARYCKHNKLTPDILNSLLHEHPGIGTIEKQADKEERVLGEKTKELATELWKAAGSPPSGPVHFLHDAHEQLVAALSGNRQTVENPSPREGG